MCIICRGEYNGQDSLVVSGCTSLTSIPEIPNVIILICRGCTSLTSLPDMSRLISLVCDDCTSLTSLPKMSKLISLSCSGCRLLTSVSTMIHGRMYNYYNCPWLEYENNVCYYKNVSKLIRLQRWYRRMIWCRYLASKEFIEWCYQPDNVGGKYAKKSIAILFTLKI